MYFVRLRPVQSLQRGQWPNWKSPLMTWKVWKSQTQACSCGHCHLAACFCIAWLRLNCLSWGSSWLLKHKINKRPQVRLLLQQILLNKPLQFGHYHLVVPKISIILFLFPRQGCIIVHGEHCLLILNSTIKKTQWVLNLVFLTPVQIYLQRADNSPCWIRAK